MSIQKQLKLLSIPRSSYYHKSERSHRLQDDLIMQAMDRIYMAEPTYGARRIRDELNKLGYKIGRKRVRRLMGIWGLNRFIPSPG